MKALKRFLFGLFVCGFLVWLVRISIPKEEDRIHDRVGALLRVLDTQRGDSTPKRRVQLERAMDFFTPDVIIHLDGSLELQELQGKERLMEAIRGSLISVNRLRIERYDSRIKVDPDGLHGEVTMTVFVHVDDTQNPHIQMVRLGFEKGGNDWRISRVESVAPIKESPP